MSNETVQELYLEELRDLYSAENQLVKALPKVIESCTSKELADAIEEHLEQTKGHVARLEQIFAMMGEDPDGEDCEAMEGLIKETKETIHDFDQGPLRDAAIIVMAQKVEHYEIAGYGSAKALAESIGSSAHADILEMTLREEKAANDKLTSIAESGVNEAAAAYV